MLKKIFVSPLKKEDICEDYQRIHNSLDVTKDLSSCSLVSHLKDHIKLKFI